MWERLPRARHRFGSFGCFGRFGFAAEYTDLMNTSGFESLFVPCRSVRIEKNIFFQKIFEKTVAKIKKCATI